jgi:hypothetical protein
VNDFTIDLLAGGNVLNFLTLSNSTIAPGTFVDESFTYTSDGAPPAGPLGIKFLTTGPVQIDYDNVRLSAIPASEPGSLALLATGLGLALFLFRRR